MSYSAIQPGDWTSTVHALYEREDKISVTLKYTPCMQENYESRMLHFHGRTASTMNSTSVTLNG